ncbi:ADP-ribosylglycohydrolase family protein [Vibrio gazogenes]|uniref:ADP-ribosylglycohydrolase n=1 Tax=Vibrio gazogenes DSM 21264 = NBRC 103151 TaxID=1123492 RepID=A0A1M5F5F5_VIBGA|nr:ADP-ribosylglycohydrolase family protein [Vibrio gazogenes]USP15416.1 ADP-ribosylglycohydrolase family protein [Vibrio gazogenes]SHF86685.1 ADP-ribosylglycohydrolase [Vibrio gazogenes DSM 21264] [Vibrio gazogenes DSM 21264 = NBRC 103151]SJN56281.1 ADP-ribosyl-[dinitrogen reductase] glycohydrolase [Vibrio gazogenes]
MTITKQDRILGTFYGQALGDSMGMPSELWPRHRVKAHFGWIDRFLDGPQENNAACYFTACQFTDDTSMALALADAIIACDGNIVPEVIARNVLTWAEGFDAFNKNIFGPSSKAAMRAIKDGTPIDALENNGVTNGAAMRVSPMGCLLPATNLDRFIEQVALASSPTHKSDVAIAGAVVVAWAVSKAIDGHCWSAIKDQLPAIALAAQTKHITTFSASVASRVELALSVAGECGGIETRMDKIYNLIGAGVSTIESVPAAVAMVEIAETDPNRCAILCANLGGDTDTIGAMATAICGALNGVQGIDASLKQQLDQKNQLDFDQYARQFLSLRAIKEQDDAS